jgi:hypothetical protein
LIDSEKVKICQDRASTVKTLFPDSSLTSICFTTRPQRSTCRT